MRRVLAVFSLLVVAAPAGAGASARTEADIARAEQMIRGVDVQILQVERLYARELGSSELDALQRSFSDAEIQFLLGEYRNASVLLYDLVGNPGFRGSGKLGDAYYYLAESLYQRGDYMGSRRYFRELLHLREGRYVDQAIKRYLQIAGRLGDYSDVESTFELARAASGGSDRPELSYTVAKFNFKRTDVDRATRIPRAKAQFEALLPGPYGLQSRYFLGVIAIEQGDLAGAAKAFEEVVQQARQRRDGAELAELANLSLGRVLYEQGRFAEAIDRYQEVSRESAAYPEALFEIAWSFVKMGEFERALRATEILLLLARETSLEPEAELLQAHLQLKLARYGEARDSYTAVINSYAPVRDELDALLTAQDDPVAYFNQLLSRTGDEALEIQELLPRAARRWASTQEEVSGALLVITDLETGRKDIAESREIGKQLLELLSGNRALQASPVIAEGMVKADAADASALAAERLLLQAELSLVRLTPQLERELNVLMRERAELDARFTSLPKTAEAVEKRRARMNERLDALEITVHRLDAQVDSLDAQVRAIKKWQADTRETRRSDPDGERIFDEELKETEALAASVRADHAVLRRQLAAEKARVIGGGADASEATLRARYDELLKRERELVARARGGGGSPLFGRIDRARGQLDAVRGRVAATRVQMQALADRKAREVRDAVHAEMRLLDQYEQDAAGVSTSAQDLVGRIAYESFKRVRQSFYALVLKADVGLVDVAWTRKRDKTDAIQKLAGDKDRDLRELDQEFRDVLQEEP